LKETLDDVFLQQDHPRTLATKTMDGMSSLSSSPSPTATRENFAKAIREARKEKRDIREGLDLLKRNEDFLKNQMDMHMKYTSMIEGAISPFEMSMRNFEERFATFEKDVQNSNTRSDG